MSLEGVSEVFAEESFEWGGKTYILTRPNFVTEAAIRKHLEEEETRLIERHRASMSMDAWRENLAGWRRDCTAGVWAYGMPDCMTALRNPEHFLRFIWYILAQKDEQQNLTVSQVETMMKDEVTGRTIAEKVNKLLSATPTIPPEVGEQANR